MLHAYSFIYVSIISYQMLPCSSTDGDLLDHAADASSRRLLIVFPTYIALVDRIERSSNIAHGISQLGHAPLRLLVGEWSTGKRITIEKRVDPADKLKRAKSDRIEMSAYLEDGDLVVVDLRPDKGVEQRLESDLEARGDRNSTAHRVMRIRRRDWEGWTGRSNDARHVHPEVGFNSRSVLNALRTTRSGGEIVIMSRML